MRFAILPSVAALTALPALAQTIPPDMPMRRVGHWEIRMLMEGREDGPNMVVQACTDADTERQLMQFGLGMRGNACERYDIRRVGQEVHIDADCQFGPMRSVTKAVMSGDFQTSYTVRIEGTTTAPGQPQPQRTLILQQARHVSQTCTGGLVPGDMVVMGQKINVRSMGGAAGSPRAQPQRPQRQP